jgi:hypothetical protein
LQKLAGAQRNRVTIHPIAASRRQIALAAGQIQKYPGMKRLPLLCAAGTPQAFESALLIPGQNDCLPFGCEWHKPFLH